MARFVLVRPALPDPGAPLLLPTLVDRLALKLAERSVAVVVTSPERGPLATARPLAAALDVSMHSAGGVEERQPGESTGEAIDRFSDGLDALLKVHPVDTFALVTGGLVVSGWLGRHCGVDPEVTERTLGQPSFVVVDRLGPTVAEVVAAV
jgi:broad specificity phosphatase PhoE